MKKLHIITDLQYGSCGKGLFAGYLAEKINPDTIVCAFGPNAGHTMYHTAVKYVNIMLPVGMITTRNLKHVLIGPGAVINPHILAEEIYRYRDILGPGKLHIHENAAVVQDSHREMESQYGFRIGSTMKGTGEAVIQKMRRDPTRRNTIGECFKRDALLGHYIVNQHEYNYIIDNADTVMLEGAQGFSLSINQGMYPYVTHRECTTLQLMSDCALPFPNPSHHWPSTDFVTVYGVARTYPIRVANRYDSDGKIIGTSGPCYPDQYEISWAEIGIQPELTTVTKLPRRVFTFSKEQVAQSIRANGVTKVFLNFCNYVREDQQIEDMINHINTMTGAKVMWTGWGPTSKDIVEL